MLSFIYRLLTRARRRDEVTLDMIGTFEEARADALSRGRWNYFAFAAREIGGLLGSPGRFIPRRWGTWVAGGGLAGLALGVAAFYLLPASYTSQAVLIVTQPQIPTNQTLVTDAGYLDALSARVRSVSVLTTIVRTHDIYRNARIGKTQYEIAEYMNNAIRIENSGDSTIRVRFTYHDYPRGANDAMEAAKVTSDLVARLLDANLKTQSERAYATLSFFEKQVKGAGVSWEQLNRETRGLKAADPLFERLTLDRDLVRKDYESLRQKLQDALMTIRVNDMKLGQLLEVRDPPSIPQGPDISLLQMALDGLGAGLLIGFLAWLRMAMRRVPEALLAPETYS